MGKKSLAEQIAELSQPKNDFDIEDNEIADPFADGSDGMSAAESDEELKTEHYVDMPKSALRKKNDKIIVDKKYTGKVTDRETLYGDNGSLRPDMGEYDQESEDDQYNEESEEENGEDGNIEESEEESDSGLSLRANSDSEVSDNDESALGNEDDADIKRQRIKAMMAKERSHIVSRLSEAATQDALKGYAIMLQHKLFDAIIDSRLKIQKALTNSNLLPANEETLSAELLGSKKTEKNLRKATEQCYDLLDRIFLLRAALYSKEKIVTEPVKQTPKKRTLDQYLATTQYYDGILNQYRSSVLTKWLAKIQNSSGSSAINASKFRALNQSAEQQVVNNLADMDRLVKRTRLNRRKIKPLGYEHYAKLKEQEEEKEETDENEDIPAGQHKSLNLEEMDLIFDDEDFYRVLLNDLVDKKIQSNDPTSGLQFALRGAASTKVKKNVDSKASKGRKLRYHVQEPIANFETPRDSLKWTDAQIDEFFASLLGQKVNMKEEEDEDEDAEEEDLVVGQDTIQLFG